MKKIILLLPFAAVLLLIFLSVSAGKEEGITETKSGSANPDTVKEKIINVPMLCQYPLLPSGCEATAAAMVLRYYGSDITPVAFASVYLACEDLFYSGEKLYGPDPYEKFAGSPFGESYCYGCFAPVIEKAVNGMTGFSAETVTGKSLSELCGIYIDNEKPLLVWVTMEMREPEAGRAWNLPDGREFVWTAGEHCMVLTGYGDGVYYFNDPRSGGSVIFPEEISEKRFSQLGSQAVLIEKTANEKRADF